MVSVFNYCHVHLPPDVEPSTLALPSTFFIDIFPLPSAPKATMVRPAYMILDEEDDKLEVTFVQRGKSDQM